MNDLCKGQLCSSKGQLYDAKGQLYEAKGEHCATQFSFL